MKCHYIEETSDVFQDLSKRVYTEWLPTASYEKVEGHELEMYYENPESGKFYCEAWIKVELKK